MTISWRILSSRLVILVGGIMTGFHPEAGAILTTAPQLVDAFQGRSAEGGPAREVFERAERLAAYLAFEESVLTAFGHASFLMSRRPPKLLNVWFLALGWRATRALQDATASGLVAVARVHLMAPGAVFDTARDLALTLGDGLRAIGCHKQGSPPAHAAIAAAGDRVGKMLNAFRDAVANDLAVSS